MCSKFLEAHLLLPVAVMIAAGLLNRHASRLFRIQHDTSINPLNNYEYYSIRLSKTGMGQFFKMNQRIRQRVSFLSENELHLFADIVLPPCEYFGWLSSSRTGEPDHRYELHLSADDIAKGGWIKNFDDAAGRVYNVTAQVMSGAFRAK